MAWNASDLALLNTYRVSHGIATSAAFTSPLNQALLSNPGIGRQSPTMARKKDKRRVSKDQLATSVRKHFNGAAVSEMEVITELVYKVRNQSKSSCKTGPVKSRKNTRSLTSWHRQGVPDAVSSYSGVEEVVKLLYHGVKVDKHGLGSVRRYGYMHRRELCILYSLWTYSHLWEKARFA